MGKITLSLIHIRWIEVTLQVGYLGMLLSNDYGICLLSVH